jgi:hypothetical protein
VLTVPDCEGFAKLHSHLQGLLFADDLAETSASGGH